MNHADPQLADGADPDIAIVLAADAAFARDDIDRASPGLTPQVERIAPHLAARRQTG
jgi:hypothetical protein